MTKEQPSAKELAEAKAKEVKAAAEPKVDALMEKLKPLLDFVKENPKLAAQVGAAMLPILAKMLFDRKDKKDEK